MHPQDDLDQLLGRAKQVEPSPFFVRNVLRTIRQEPKGWFSLPRWACAAALTVLALGLFLLPNPGTAMLEQIETPADFAVVSNLDDLLAYEENQIWPSENSNF